MSIHADVRITVSSWPPQRSSADVERTRMKKRVPKGVENNAPPYAKETALIDKIFAESTAKWILRRMPLSNRVRSDLRNAPQSLRFAPCGVNGARGSQPGASEAL